MANKIYAVSCFSSPPGFKIKEGDIAEVTGLGRKLSIVADSITTQEDACTCGPRPVAVKEKSFGPLAEQVHVKGKVGKVVKSSLGIEFELKTQE